MYHFGLAVAIKKFLFLSLSAVAIYFGTDLALNKVYGLGNVVVYESSPLYGYRPAASQQITRRGKNIQFNNIGLRNSDDWSSNDGIMIIGDSITYGGSYIDNSELFTTKLSELINKPVGNAGVNAWGVHNMVGLVVDTEFLPTNHLIMLIPEGDMYRGLNRIGGLPFFTKPANSAFDELAHFWHYNASLKRHAEVGVWNIPTEAKKIANRSREEILRLKNYCEQNDVRFTLIITPTRAQSCGFEEIDSVVYSALKDLSPIYLLDHIEKGPNNAEWFVDVAHLSANGHAHWANLLAKVIQ